MRVSRSVLEPIRTVQVCKRLDCVRGGPVVSLQATKVFSSVCHRWKSAASPRAPLLACTHAEASAVALSSERSFRSASRWSCSPNTQQTHVNNSAKCLTCCAEIILHGRRRREGRRKPRLLSNDVLIGRPCLPLTSSLLPPNCLPSLTRLCTRSAPAWPPTASGCISAWLS